METTFALLLAVSASGSWSADHAEPEARGLGSELVEPGSHPRCPGHRRAPPQPVFWSGAGSVRGRPRRVPVRLNAVGLKTVTEQRVAC
jgi:hypothetical protein